MNEIQNFDFNGNVVRVMTKDGEPWWVAKDVCDILEIANARDAIAELDDDEKNTVAINDGIPGNPNKNIISEAGLYSLILRSRKPEAKAFKRWVTHEVLPSIRKTGGYGLAQWSIPQTFAEALSLAAKLEEQRAALAAVNVKQDQLIRELKPKADYVDSILRNPGLVAITQIAKDYGMSGCEMNSLLHELGVQYKLGDQWLLYSKHQSHGYTHSDTFEFEHKDGRKDIHMHTKWTQKGRLFLYNLLKQNDTLPLIERLANGDAMD